jgi:bacillolysin
VVARVEVPLGAAATGRVRFTVDGIVIVRTVSIKDGKAVLMLSERQLRRLGKGKHRATATYLGSATTQTSRGEASFRLR